MYFIKLKKCALMVSYYHYLFLDEDLYLRIMTIYISLPLELLRNICISYNFSFT